MTFWCPWPTGRVRLSQMLCLKPVVPGPRRTVREYFYIKIHVYGVLTWELSLVGADLVTEYDRAVEKMISTSLEEKYPDYE